MEFEGWKHRRVLVTGCTGLLGTWLTEWLVRRQADVVGLIRDSIPESYFYRLALDKQIMAVHGALEDYALIERTLNEYRIETIYHLAAQTQVGIANDNPLSTFSSNIQGTWNVLEAARRCGKVRAVVVASSDKAYGIQAELPYREDAPLAGCHPYDVSKSCGDLLTRTYWHTYRVSVAVTRCGNFYGPGDLNFERLVPGTIRSLIDGQPPVIRSDGTMKRDYVYIKDAVMAYVLLAEKLLAGQAQGEAYNFSNEFPVTVLELATLIGQLMGRDDLKPVILNTATNEIPHQYLSAEKARRDLGWKPQYTLEQGLQETIAGYREFLAEKDKRSR